MDTLSQLKRQFCPAAGSLTRSSRASCHYGADGCFALHRTRPNVEKKHLWEERRAKSRLLGTRIACRVARCDAGSPPGDPEGSPQGDPHSRASNVTSRVAREKTECVSSTLELDFFNLSGLPWQLGFDQVRRDIVKHGVSHAGQPPTEMHERGFFASRADSGKEQGAYLQQTYPIASGVL